MIQYLRLTGPWARSFTLLACGQDTTNTAKVEVDYTKATGQEKNPFLETATTAGAHQPAIATTVQAGPGNGISSITRHTLPG